jgi:hypothetical protein
MMDSPIRKFLEKKTDWMITWKDNKVRWVIFYYILGLIFSCVYTFIQEALLPLPIRFLYKSLIVTLVIPLLTVLLSVRMEMRRAPEPNTDR